MNAVDTNATVERVARDSYGRLVALLAARWRDVAAAEDAVGDAFQAAVEKWPTTGIPANPEAWLLTTARRRLIDGSRRARVHADATPELIAMVEEAQNMTAADGVFPDERLKLLFTCAHPAIDAAARTPLMLQTVLGLDAKRIASAFLVQPTSMGQRLTRAKNKIRDAGISFDAPEAKQLPSRLDAVLDAIYAAYGAGWNEIAGAESRHRGLAAEAIDLGRLLVKLMPGEPEALGLLALMLHCEARRAARRTSSSAYVPLSYQDVKLWSQPMIEEAETCLTQAAAAGRMGRFQLEAAIQSVHAQRARLGWVDWEAIALLYEGLIKIAPAIGAVVGRAAAVGEARGPAAGWQLLEQIPKDAVQSYQPYWAVAAHLLKRMDRTAESKAAFTRAIGLCEDQAVREFLIRELDAL
jgi:RNA polymerase sigma-70 factor (ECF subfamily)